MDFPRALEIYGSLRLVEKKYENRKTSTGNIIISDMAKDAADAIKYLSDELFEKDKKKIKKGF